MQSLEEIKRQITGTDSLKSIIRTMKIIASVNVRQYERILKSLVSYNHTIELSFQVVLKSFNKFNPYFTRRKYTAGRTGIIILGSDLGLCGQFNEQISAFTYQSISGMKLEKKKAVIMAVGEKVVPRIEDTGLTISENIRFPAGLQTGIISVLHELIFILDQWRENLNIENILLFYNKPAGDLIDFVPYMHQLFPVDPDYFLELRSKKWDSSSLPLYNMNTAQLLSKIIRNHLYVSLYRAFAESLAAENTARLVAMQAAEKHIEEHIDTLRGQYNSERQENITSELLDIIAGFETLTAY